MSFSARKPFAVVLVFVAFVLASSGGAAAAFAAQGLTFPPNGDNPQAAVMQSIGPVRVTIDYSSPRVVRGSNDRHGKIWGELVPWGLSDLGLTAARNARGEPARTRTRRSPSRTT